MNKPMLATAQQLEYAFNFDFNPTLSQSSLGSAAIIPIEGLLMHRFGGFGSSYEGIRSQIQSALDDSKVDHIILDIDSGGGEVSGLFDLVDFIVEARNQKTITALVNEHAYSAAYLIASSANQIVAAKTAGVGSIGVIVAHLDQSEAEKKIGLNFTEVFAGKHKADFSPHQPLTEQAMLEMQTQVDSTYELLVQTLARNRQSVPSVFKETEAKTYTAEDALSLTLIDKIQSPYKFLEEHMMTDEPMMEEDAIPEHVQLLNDERNRIKEIMQMCKLANLPESSEQLIEQGASIEDARKHLFEQMVARSGEPISNQLPEKQSEGNSMIEAMVQGLGGKSNARV